MNTPTVTDSIQPSFCAPLSERFVVWLRNLWHWRTAWAVKHLSKQLQQDPGFRESWHANIAMPIYDATRPACHCQIHNEEDEHLPHCPFLDERLDFSVQPIKPEHANYIADKLLKHLFNA